MGPHDGVPPSTNQLYELIYIYTTDSVEARISHHAGRLVGGLCFCCLCNRAEEGAIGSQFVGLFEKCPRTTEKRGRIWRTWVSYREVNKSGRDLLYVS